MPSDKPLRLRRLPIGKADPSIGTKFGGTEVERPLDPVHDPEGGRRGFPDNTSNMAAEGSHGTYEDRASVPKPQTGLVNSRVPFVLKR